MPQINADFVKKVVSITSVVFLSLLSFSVYLDKCSSFSDIFNKVAVGFGTLLAGLGAILAAGEYIVKPKRGFELIKKQYPRKNLRKPNDDSGNFELLRTQSHGRIYLRDLQNNTNQIRWIKNWPTFEALGFNKGDWKEVKDDYIDEYKQGDEIVAPDS